MNVKATLSPDDLARACADAMWKEDDASKGLGMEIVEIKAGHATLAMTVRPQMVNGQRIAHGGFIFTLADSDLCLCLQLATMSARSRRKATSPSSGRASLAIDWSRPRAKSRAADVPEFTTFSVTADDVVIAEFRGHSRTIAGTWLPAAETDNTKIDDQGKRRWL